MPTVTDPAAFIEALLADPEFRRELEEDDQRKWEIFTLRLLAWDGESEDLVEPWSKIRAKADSHLE